MAEQILDQLRDTLEGQIDFKGQKLAELLATILLSTAGALSFVVGFILQDIVGALYIGLGVTGLTFFLVVPPWPFYRRHPVNWLPSNGFRKESDHIGFDRMVIT
ncbi:hypothetical protein K3495_g8148 [Podosphaera aphanis]|nr:hypothetical protein K3495_g8148 [Podosphaera aphanis]